MSVHLFVMKTGKFFFHQAVGPTVVCPVPLEPMAMVQSGEAPASETFPTVRFNLSYHCAPDYSPRSFRVYVQEGIHHEVVFRVLTGLLREGAVLGDTGDALREAHAASQVHRDRRANAAALEAFKEFERRRRLEEFERRRRLAAAAVEMEPPAKCTCDIMAGCTCGVFKEEMRGKGK